MAESLFNSHEYDLGESLQGYLVCITELIHFFSIVYTMTNIVQGDFIKIIWPVLLSSWIFHINRSKTVVVTGSVSRAYLIDVLYLPVISLCNPNMLFLWHKSVDIDKMSLFPKFQLILRLRVWVMHVLLYHTVAQATMLVISMST